MVRDGRSIEADASIEADICIVGAGPAGITLACELAGCDQRVLVLESGAETTEREPQTLSAGFSLSDAHPTPDLYRHRKVGGATAIWGGRCIPFDPIDFEERDYVSGSGWPFRRDDLDPFYDAAMTYCEAGRFAFDAREALPKPSWIVEGFSHPDVEDIGIERFSMPTDFGVRNRRRLAKAPNVTVVTHATCIRLVPSDGRAAIGTVDVATLSGGRFTVRAGRFVVAAGGLEAVRLLDTCRTALAGSAHLGRHYMCHIEGTLGLLTVMPKTRPLHWAFERTLDGVYARRRFSISPAAQRREKTLSMIARLHYSHVADASHGQAVLSAMFLTKQFLIPEFRRKFAAIERAAIAAQAKTGGLVGAHIGNVLRDLPGLARFAGSWIWARHGQRRRMPAVALHSPDGAYPLDFNAEQSPNPDSRVLLSDEVDRLGMRKLLIDWRMSERDIGAIARNFRIMRDAFSSSGVARLSFSDGELEDEIARCTPVGGHHIGTARMSAGPADGVVDSDGRVHGTENLFVAGSAVFPTSSHANPTLTIVALAIRLARSLRGTK